MSSSQTIERFVCFYVDLSKSNAPKIELLCDIRLRTKQKKIKNICRDTDIFT